MSLYNKFVENINKSIKVLKLTRCQAISIIWTLEKKKIKRQKMFKIWKNKVHFKIGENRDMSVLRIYKMFYLMTYF